MRKLSDGTTDGQTDGQTHEKDFIRHCPNNVEHVGHMFKVGNSNI